MGILQQSTYVSWPPRFYSDSITPIDTGGNMVVNSFQYRIPSPPVTRMRCWVRACRDIGGCAPSYAGRGLHRHCLSVGRHTPPYGSVCVKLPLHGVSGVASSETGISITRPAAPTSPIGVMLHHPQRDGQAGGRTSPTRDDCPPPPFLGRVVSESVRRDMQ